VIKCKVLVRLTVEVERTAWSEETTVDAMFKAVASDAVSQVHRELGGYATIVGDPVVETIMTLPREVEVPKP